MYVDVMDSIESVVANSFVPSHFLLNGHVSVLGTVHHLLTLSLLSTWIIALHVVFSYNSYFVYDMIFLAQQLQVKCSEQQDLYMVFVNLNTAFDTVSRDLLWNILRKFGCPPSFIAMLQQFHSGMCAQVVMAGSQSSSFPVDAGVKQGCVLAPIIFNQLLVAMILEPYRDLQSSDFVGIEYRHDGGLFNLRRLQAKTKTSSAMIFSFSFSHTYF